MDLTGTWRAAVADDDLRRAWQDDGFDDSGWEPIAVPGHWRRVPAFAEVDGPLLYRHAFDAEPPEPGRRAWLTFDGTFYQGDVWLDGGYLGDTEGYFAPHAFEVTEALAERRGHHLAVEVTCDRPGDRTAKRNLTGVFQHWDAIDPAWNPGGIWRPVHIRTTGPVRIAALRVSCREAAAGRAVVVLRACLDSDAARTVCLQTQLGGQDHQLDHPLAAGDNEVEWTLTVDRPALWWPRALGDAVLHDLVVRVALGPDEGGTTSDERRLRTGLRQMRLRSWVLQVNGERLFLKGSNLGPSRAALAEASADAVIRDIALATDVGLDLLRVHAHIAPPALYAAADEAGMLLWQDLPLQRGMARGVRKQAVRQATAAVDLLGHHPSIAVWCGHNEPLGVERDPGTLADPSARRRGVLWAIAGHELPTWNKTVLDRSVKRALERADGSRPVVAHSGVLPHPPQLDGTDSHLYLGWYHGDERDLPGLLRAVPRLARFVSELGAQAVPTSADFCEPERWPDLDWDRLASAHGMHAAVFDRVVPPSAYATFEGWQAATQTYQAEVIRRQVEAIRRLKYRPSGGFAQMFLADAQPAISFSVLDHERVPKTGFDALTAACRPVIVVADRLPAVVAPGAAVALDVHVVSDRRAQLDDAEVTARLTWNGGERSWRWRGDLAADCCERVGTMQIVAPDVLGMLALELRCMWADGATDNRYESLISAR